MKEGTLKILGSYEIAFNRMENRHILNFKTVIPSQPANERFFTILMMNDFKVLSLNNKTAEVLLPERWIHVKTGKHTEELVDAFGRIRAEINTKENSIKFLKRFNYQLEIIRKDGAIPRVIMHFTDAGKKSIETSFEIDIAKILPYDEVQTLVFNWDTMMDKLYEGLCTEAERILTKEFPEWRNEIAYW